ncbi:ParB N-terminal domain-containing protein [Paenibacillus humicus]|uniref:ParB N-terminal domain-containing protein n=1 Tax=Paenibacillus humicus TaxID=412861 RepID=UPI003D2B7D31
MVQKIKVSLEKLHFDPDNPRLPQRLIGTRDEKKVLDFMIKNGNIVELMQSIGETGYSDAEPLLVVPSSGTAAGEYIVVEGNRRLTALKLLSHPELASLRKNIIADTVKSAKHIPKDIPVILYPSRGEILDYLGYRHITGVKDWGALEKARYLDQLYNSHIDNVGSDQIYSVLAKMIGSRTDYVSKLHTALKLYNLANDDAYYGAEIEETDFNFSWLTTALSFSDTVSYLGLSGPGDSTLEGLDKGKFAQLFEWMFDPKKKKVQDSRQISELNQILKSESARHKLEKGSSISEAILFTSAPNDTFHTFIVRAKENLQNSKNMIEQLNKYPDDTVSLLEEIEKLCKTIRGSISENFPNPNSGIEKLTDKLTEEQIKRLLSFIDKQGE